jgi:PAS domain-containing protein
MDLSSAGLAAPRDARSARAAYRDGALPEEWAANEDLSIVSISSGLAEKLGTTAEEAIGKPLTRFVKLEENEGRRIAVARGCTSRTDFDGQRARPRRGSEEVLILRGTPVTLPTAGLRAFQGEAFGESEVAGDSVSYLRPSWMSIIDEALRSPLDRIIESADRIVQQSDGLCAATMPITR